MNILEWETKEILITVKAYPNPSKKYQETTCVAGVSGGEWIRLYPINFRGLPPDKAFKKYELIKVKVKKRISDPRPESFIPDSDSIEKVGFIDTRNDPYWEKRKEYLLPTVSGSMCEILRLQKQINKSLGMFKPKKVLDFSIIQENDEWSYAERAIQKSLFGPELLPLEKIPFSFKYSFICHDEGCKGHKMKIVDWETAQFYRKIRKKYKDNMNLIEREMKKRWLDELFSTNRDPYFYVGNVAKFPRSFIILGVFWPLHKKEEQLRLI